MRKRGRGVRTYSVHTIGVTPSGETSKVSHPPLHETIGEESI
jgi:hypothetical protein